MSDEYRIKAEKWDGDAKKWVSCGLILTVVFVKNLKHGKKGEILAIEETR